MKKHPRYALSRDDAIAMRREAATGATARELASRFRVGVHTARAVLRYARFRPELSPEHHAELARFAAGRGMTRDDALDLVLRRGLGGTTRSGRPDGDHPAASAAKGTSATSP